MLIVKKMNKEDKEIQKREWGIAKKEIDTILKKIQKKKVKEGKRLWIK